MNSSQKPIGLAIISLLLVCSNFPAQNKPSSQGVAEPRLLKLKVIVTDRSGRAVGGLPKEDFQVFEEGKTQTISFFSAEQWPLSYGLVIDNSGSLRTQLKQIRETAKEIVSSNGDQDEAFVARFASSDKIQFLQDLATNKEALASALDRLRIESGQTALIDALYISAQHLSQKSSGKQEERHYALILISDGEDRRSFYKEDQLVELLHQSDIQIFVIGLVEALDKQEGLIRKSPRAKAEGLLEKLAKETGGRVLYVRSSIELPTITGEIIRSLRNQYVIGYYPLEQTGKSYRKIEVKVTDSSNGRRRTAITRSRYALPVR